MRRLIVCLGLSVVVALVGADATLADGPATSIDVAPTNLTNSTSGSFSFSSPDAVDHFVCTLDGAVTDPCSSSFSFGGLGEGSHSFAVYGVDATATAGPDATFSWTIDTTGPTLSQPNITKEEDANGVPSAVVTFSPTANDPHGPNTVSCSPSSGSTFSGLGAHTVNCSMDDGLGNTSSGSFTVTVQDTTPPTLAGLTNIARQ